MCDYDCLICLKNCEYIHEQSCSIYSHKQIRVHEKYISVRMEVLHKNVYV